MQDDVTKAITEILCELGVDPDAISDTATLGDELVIRKCDLDFAKPYRADIFNFAAHRRPEHYGLITERTGAIPPPEDQ